MNVQQTYLRPFKLLKNGEVIQKLSHAAIKKGKLVSLPHVNKNKEPVLASVAPQEHPVTMLGELNQHQTFNTTAKQGSNSFLSENLNEKQMNKTMLTTIGSDVDLSPSNRQIELQNASMQGPQEEIINLHLKSNRDQTLRLDSLN